MKIYIILREVAETDEDYKESQIIGAFSKLSKAIRVADTYSKFENASRTLGYSIFCVELDASQKTIEFAHFVRVIIKKNVKIKTDFDPDEF